MDYIKNVEKKNNQINLLIDIIGITILAGLLMISEVFGDMQKRTIEANSSNNYQSQIAEEVLRFHVIANSDSKEDQELKLKVKETVLATVRPMLAEANSKEEAENIVLANMNEIESVADKVIKEEGYFYSSKGVIGKTTFPIKQYGDMVFPAGEYEAFRILLGEAKGKNWWCVMFPTLCYVDEAYDVITEENKEQFREILTEEEYESLLLTMEATQNEVDEKQTGQIFYKCKSLIWLNKMIDYFSK